jgi:16S rRNA (cytidine1402-2'-O)-methyltransferase
VATPIGNLSDLSHRAIEVLQRVALIAAEDTRVSRVLCDHIGARAARVSLHEHNEREVSARLVERLLAGEDIALVSDAGTPAISDPGAGLVDAARRAGVPVVPIPGASAPVALLSAAGLPPGPFLFEGFLPSKASARRARLHLLQRSVDAIGAHLVVFESPHRIADTLSDLAAAFGEARGLVIGRELTKRFEQIHRCPCGEALAWLQADPDHGRGEFVVAVAAIDAAAREQASATAAGPSADEVLDALLAHLPVSQAVRVAERLLALPHRELYARALARADHRRDP